MHMACCHAAAFAFVAFARAVSRADGEVAAIGSPSRVLIDIQFVAVNRDGGNAWYYEPL
jgi:hypothetical protein